MAPETEKNTSPKRVTVCVEIRDEQTGERRHHEQTVMIPLTEGESIELAYVSAVDQTRMIRGV